MFSRKRNDTMFVTSLRMGVARASSKLYDGTSDLIASDGGASLTISGKYIDGTRFAIIDQVTSFLYYKNGDNMHLISKPYIMDTKTFEAVENTGYELPPDNEVDVFPVQDVEEYIAFLFKEQGKIMKAAKHT